MAQATDLERLFIERVNVIRDEVGSPPLILIEEHRYASLYHVDYILSTGHASHTQDGTDFPSCSDRVKHFSKGELNSMNEIIAFNRHALTNDTAIVDQFIEGFLSSKLHRYSLLNFLARSCVMAIHHSPNVNLCVVDFTNGEFGTPYAQYTFNILEASEEETEMIRTDMDRFADYYQQRLLRSEQ